MKKIAMVLCVLGLIILFFPWEWVLLAIAVFS